MGHNPIQTLLRLNNTKQKNTARVATSQVSADLVLFSCLLTIYAHNVVGPRCQENTRRKHFIFPYADVVGPYCHPLHVLLPIPVFFDHVDKREGGAAASAPKRAEDVGVNDLGDGGAAMRALRRSQPWEAEAGGPAGAGLVLAAGGRQD